MQILSEITRRTTLLCLLGQCLARDNLCFAVAGKGVLRCREPPAPDAPLSLYDSGRYTLSLWLGHGCAVQGG
mgnify:CR=1 FL=1